MRVETKGDGMLHIGPHVLPVVVSKTVDRNVLRESLQTVAAASLNSMWSADHAMMQRRCDRNLFEALATLVGAGWSVDLLCHDREEMEEEWKQEGCHEEIHFHVWYPWSLGSMMLPPDPPVPRTSVRHSVKLLEQSDEAFRHIPPVPGHHTYVVRMEPRDGFEVRGDLLTPQGLGWHDVVSCDDVVFRFACVPSMEPSVKVREYWNGFLFAQDTLDETLHCQGMTLYIETNHSSIHAGKGGFRLPDVVRTEALDAFARFFLCTTRGPELARSSIVREMLQRLHPWRCHLRSLWCVENEQRLIDVVCKEGVAPDALVCLAPVRKVLLGTMASCNALDVMGLGLLRRFQSFGHTRMADWRATALTEHGIVGFKMIPLTLQRFRHLYEVGALDDVCEYEGHLSPYGFVVDATMFHTVAVPYDAEPRDLTRLLLDVTTLLTSLPSYFSSDPSSPTDIVVGFGEVHCDGPDLCAPNEVLQPYRVHLSVDEGIVLIKDDGCKECIVDEDHVLGVDSVEEKHVPHCPSRVSRTYVADVFSMLGARLAQRPPLQACLLEVQARRLCSEWTLEGIDCGANLSSFGMSVLLTVTLTHWMGARARVMLSQRSRAAMVGILGGDGDEVQLVDPCRSLMNGFDVERSQRTVYPQLFPYEVKPQCFLEVKQRTTWHVCVVLRVDKIMETAEVRLLLTSAVMTLSLRQHTWRRLARNSDTDVDAILRRFVKGDVV